MRFLNIVMQKNPLRVSYAFHCIHTELVSRMSNKRQKSILFNNLFGQDREALLVFLSIMRWKTIFSDLYTSDIDFMWYADSKSVKIQTQMA